MIQAVIFDMDGVLVDSEPLSEQHEREYFKKYNVVFKKGYFEKLKGKHAFDYWSQIISDFNLPLTPESIIDDIRESYLTFLRSQKKLRPVKGTRQLIKQLRRENFKLAVASSANPKRVDLILKICRLESLFDIITNADTVKRGKPAPDIFLMSAQQLGVSPSACLVIEDTTSGVKAGKAAGMKVVGFAGLSDKQDLSLSDKTIHSFDELTYDIIKSF